MRLSWESRALSPAWWCHSQDEQAQSKIHLTGSTWVWLLLLQRVPLSSLLHWWQGVGTAPDWPHSSEEDVCFPCLTTSRLRLAFTSRFSLFATHTRAIWVITRHSRQSFLSLFVFHSACWQHGRVLWESTVQSLHSHRRMFPMHYHQLRLSIVSFSAPGKSKNAIVKVNCQSKISQLFCPSNTSDPKRILRASRPSFARLLCHTVSSGFVLRSTKQGWRRAELQEPEHTPHPLHQPVFRRLHSWFVLLWAAASMSCAANFWSHSATYWGKETPAFTLRYAMGHFSPALSFLSFWQQN